MIFDTFDGRLLCIFLFFVLLGFVGKTSFSYVDHETLLRNLHLYALKKQNKISSFLIGL
jgi:hypothetical protein